MVEQVSEKLKLGDEEFCVHFWNREKLRPGESTVVIVYHGFGAHGLYPTVKYAAELLAGDNKDSNVVVAADMRGHGQSPGLPGFIPSVDALLEDACNVVDYAVKEFQPKKLFLLGSSMGGTIALHVAKKKSENVAGVLLLAPMLKLSVSGMEETLLSGLASVFPQWNVIPSSSTNAEKQYRDEKKREECENDVHTKKTKSNTIRVGSANSCVSLAKSVVFSKVEVPFWLGVADEDVVVDKQGSLDLFDQSPSSDKTMKRYAALHGLLCEPSPLYDEIAKDILDWMHDRQ